MRVAAGGGHALMTIRPAGVRITSPGDADCDLKGQVTDVAFRGHGYEHAIDTDGHGRFTGVFSPTRAARGENVGLLLDPGGCHRFPGSADPG